MPDTKITDLTAATAATGDEVPANRSGADKKLLAQDIAAIGRGITTIDSGNLPAAATKAITGIPQDFSYLVLVINGWSQDTNTSILRVRVGNGGVYDTTASNYVGYHEGGVGGLVNFTANALASLVDGASITTAQTGSICLAIFSYQAGPPTHCSFRNSSNNVERIGISTNLGTAAVDSLEISISAAGSFDAGTYALYGIR